MKNAEKARFILIINKHQESDISSKITVDQKGSSTRLPHNTVPDIILLGLGRTYTRQSGSTLG